MHAGHMIALIVRIVNIDFIRPARFQIICIITGDRHIRRILVSLIVLFPKTPIRVLIKIRNGNHIGIAVRIGIRCLPDALQGIPHGCFIGKKHDFFSVLRQIILDAIFQPRQLLLNFFWHFPARIFIRQALTHLINVLAVFLENMYKICILFT